MESRGLTYCTLLSLLSSKDAQLELGRVVALRQYYSIEIIILTLTTFQNEIHKVLDTPQSATARS
jgi:hypothetical protein